MTEKERLEALTLEIKTAMDANLAAISIGPLQKYSNLPLEDPDDIQLILLMGSLTRDAETVTRGYYFHLSLSSEDPEPYITPFEEAVMAVDMKKIDMSQFVSFNYLVNYPGADPQSNNTTDVFGWIQYQDYVDDCY